MLYLGRRRNAYLVGLDLAESEALLDELWAFATRRNSPGSTSGGSATWCCGTTAAPCTGAILSMLRRRIMHRTQIKGEAPPMA